MVEDFGVGGAGMKGIKYSKGEHLGGGKHCVVFCFFLNEAKR